MLVALCLTTPALGDAPVFGPDRQYENFDAYDQTIKDRFTKLRWRRRITEGPVTHAVATSRCAAIQCVAPQPASCWRLPTVKELLTIVDEAPSREYDEQKLQEVNKFIDDGVFPETPTDVGFWTSSIDPAQSSRAYTVEFGTGLTNPDNRTSNAYYRCVTYEGP